MRSVVAKPVRTNCGMISSLMERHLKDAPLVVVVATIDLGCEIINPSLLCKPFILNLVIIVIVV